MKFRMTAGLLWESLALDEARKVAMSLDGDELSIEMRFIWRTQLRVGGVDSGLAVVDFDDLREAVQRLGDEVVEVESLGDTLWVRSGAEEFHIECIYERDRP